MSEACVEPTEQGRQVPYVKFGEVYQDGGRQVVVTHSRPYSSCPNVFLAHRIFPTYANGELQEVLGEQIEYRRFGSLVLTGYRNLIEIKAAYARCLGLSPDHIPDDTFSEEPIADEDTPV